MRGGLFSHLQGVTVLGLPGGPPGFEFRPAQHLGLRSPCCLPRYQLRVNVPLWDIR